MGPLSSFLGVTIFEIGPVLSENAAAKHLHGDLLGDVNLPKVFATNLLSCQVFDNIMEGISTDRPKLIKVEKVTF